MLPLDYGEAETRREDLPGIICARTIDPMEFNFASEL